MPGHGSLYDSLLGYRPTFGNSDITLCQFTNCHKTRSTVHNFLLCYHTCRLTFQAHTLHALGSISPPISYIGGFPAALFPLCAYSSGAYIIYCFFDSRKQLRNHTGDKKSSTLQRTYTRSAAFDKPQTRAYSANFDPPSVRNFIRALHCFPE